MGRQTCPSRTSPQTFQITCRLQIQISHLKGTPPHTMPLRTILATDHRSIVFPVGKGRRRKQVDSSNLRQNFREYMITKDKDDFSVAMRNISTKPIKSNVPEIENLCPEELPQGEKNWTVSLYQPHLRPTVPDGLLIPGLSLLPEPFSQTVQLRSSSAQSSSTTLVPWEPLSPRTNRFNDNDCSTNLWHKQTASRPAYGIADICEILDDTNCAHTDGEDEKMELN